jgi:hypothetical protein
MTQYDSPFMGWIVPHPWQEPDYDASFDPEGEEDQVDDDVDEEGYLIIRN